ncbi:hypothetical protein LSTR_LSTR008756 [Laodelphax striatellus]|uniref:Nuclear pore complex protein Nup85 n=1 Tax=Laodelphax striatellus TaxID=195883 RepID=A0A482XPY3_LAOST|nr:hypothetical protein LSTR_LSTR008756 [Laodelphax striatellus]
MVKRFSSEGKDAKEDPSSSSQTILIPDELCEKAGLTLQWSGIGELGIHAFKHVDKLSIDNPSEFAPTDTFVHNLRTDSILFEPVIRKLVNESNGTFLAVQKLTPSTSARSETLALSRQYRSIVRACIENLQISELDKNTTYKLTPQQRQHYVAIFYNIEFIWHLCEILFVDSVPGAVVLPHLLDWIRFHFPDTERAAGQILTGPLETGAELRNSDYWDVVIGLIMQGSLEPARALLRLHSNADSECFLQAESLLKTLPVFKVYGGLSTAEFRTRWHTWQTNVSTKVESGVFTSEKNLNTVMKIISGDESSVNDMKSHCETWYQLLVAMLLYKEPTVKTFELNRYATSCMGYFGGPERMKVLDEIIMDLFECNILEVIKKLHLSSDSGWAATHLTNLLHYCGRLNIDSQAYDSRLDENLLIEYGCLLMSHNSLWQVGVTYLDHCGPQGRACLELLLPRLKPGSESRTLKIIQIAAERDMPNTVNSICKVQGMRCLQRKRIGQALCWALKSQDPGFATHLADKLLLEYTKGGTFNCLDLLDNLGSCMLISDRLTFLGKYCEFQQLFRNGATREAAVLLTSLFTSKLCPKYFTLSLLMDSLPLLESTDVTLLSAEDTSNLLSCLEELADDCASSANQAAVMDKIKLIRLAMNKNLAKSLIFEACHPQILD